MPSMRGRVVPVLLAAAVIVGGANLAAYAANGSPLLAGKKNTATKTTTIKNKKGTALSLKSRAGTPAFTVSNAEKVPGLNADLVDGLDGPALQNKAYVYALAGSSAAGSITFALPGLPPGKYLAGFSINAQVGGGPAFFGCMFRSGTSFVAGNLGAAALGDWWVSGSGYLDTTARAYSLVCQTDGSAITIPVTPADSAHVVLTRVDDVATAAQSGARDQGKGAFGR